MDVRADTVRYTGRNAAEVRAWVNDVAPCPWGESWFVARSSTAATGGQAWRYLADGEGWGGDVKAAVYDDATAEWLPVRTGDEIHHTTDGFTVTTETPTGRNGART